MSLKVLSYLIHLTRKLSAGRFGSARVGVEKAVIGLPPIFLEYVVVGAAHR